MMLVKLNNRELRAIYAFGFTGPSGFVIKYRWPSSSNETAEELSYIGQVAAGQQPISFEIEVEEYRFSAPKCRLLRYIVEPDTTWAIQDPRREMISIEFAVIMQHGVKSEKS
jgi:hypothetical protein